MMSKLTLIFTNGNTGTDVRKITSCVINGLVLDGSFNPVTGDCAADASSPASALTMTPTVTDDEARLSLILFPQSVGTVTLKITDSYNQEYSCQLQFENNRLASSNNYLYSIKVTKTAMNVEKFGIVNWTEEKAEAIAKSE